MVLRTLTVAVALFVVIAVGGPAGGARAGSLYWIVEDCNNCSPVTRAGVDSVAPIAPIPHVFTVTAPLGATSIESTAAGAETWKLDAIAGAGVIIPSAEAGGAAAGPVTIAAAQILQVPLTPTALFPAGTPITLSLNYVVTGSLQTDAIPPTPSGPLSSSQMIASAHSMLRLNTDPADFLSDLQRFGFAADFDTDGDVHAFGDGTTSSSGAFAGLGANSSFLVRITTAPVTAHVGDVLTVGLGVFVAASESVFFPGTYQTSADLSHTLTLPTDGQAAFNLPDGYTINTPDGRIVDNHFVPVPEPGIFGLLGASLVSLGLVRLRR
jgi:hypothetical protein